VNDHGAGHDREVEPGLLGDRRIVLPERRQQIADTEVPFLNGDGAGVELGDVQQRAEQCFDALQRTVDARDEFPLLIGQGSFR
jgi:hypothetical protein